MVHKILICSKESCKHLELIPLQSKENPTSQSSLSRTTFKTVSKAKRSWSFMSVEFSTYPKFQIQTPCNSKTEEGNYLCPSLDICFFRTDMWIFSAHTMWVKRKSEWDKNSFFLVTSDRAMTGEQNRQKSCFHVWRTEASVWRCLSSTFDKEQ